MRLGIAEVDEHATAHVLGDKPGEAGSRVRDAAVVGADDLAQILGIVARRQRRRANKIAEHHRQLAPLRLARDWRSRSRCRWCFGGAERADSIEQPAAMADGCDPKLAQILRRQPAQVLSVDVVVAERGRILFQPEAAQPSGHIHSRRLGGASLPGLSIAMWRVV